MQCMYTLLSIEVYGKTDTCLVYRTYGLFYSMWWMDFQLDENVYARIHPASRTVDVKYLIV